MSEPVADLLHYRQQIRNEGWEEGREAGRRAERAESHERYRRLHGERMKVHARRFLKGAVLTLALIGLLASGALPQLHDFLQYVIGGAAVFMVLQAYRWDMHRDAHLRERS